MNENDAIARGYQFTGEYERIYDKDKLKAKITTIRKSGYKCVMVVNRASGYERSGEKKGQITGYSIYADQKYHDDKRRQEIKNRLAQIPANKNYAKKRYDEKLAEIEAQEQSLLARLKELESKNPLNIAEKIEKRNIMKKLKNMKHKTNRRNPEKTIYDLPKINWNDISEVYSGRSGCMCGCKGKYTPTVIGRVKAGKKRGYAYDENDASDRTVEMMVNKVRVLGKKYGIEVGQNYYFVDTGNHYYAIYLFEDRKLVNPIGSSTFVKFGKEPGFQPIVEDINHMNPFMVLRSGGCLGDQGNGEYYNGKYIVKKDLTQEEAKELAKRRNKSLSPGEKSYYRLHYSVVKQNPGTAWHKKMSGYSREEQTKSTHNGPEIKAYYKGRADAHDFSAMVSKFEGMPNPKKGHKVHPKVRKTAKQGSSILGLAILAGLGYWLWKNKQS